MCVSFSYQMDNKYSQNDSPVRVLKKSHLQGDEFGPSIISKTTHNAYIVVFAITDICQQRYIYV